MKSIILCLFLSSPVAAQVIDIQGPYAGLNDTDSSVTIAPGAAQDLLNVDIAKDGQSIKKRKGYALNSTLNYSTSPVNGSIAFKDPNGNNVRLFANDRYIYKSVNGGAYTAITSTSTFGAKWSFCEANGRVYAFNDAHEMPWSWDNTSFTYYSSWPKGSICAVTPSRLLISGTTDYPNRIYASASGDYTDFTIGTDVGDPWFEGVGLSGEKLTNIFATQAEVLAFKNKSLTSYQGDNQYDLVPSVISNRVGMSEVHPLVYHEGIVYFKGSDGKIWAYANGQLTELTKKLETFTGLVTKSSTRVEDYTTKAEWDSGILTNTLTSLNPGSVDGLVVAYSENSGAEFINSTRDNISIESGVMALSTKYSKFANMGFEDGDVSEWTNTSDFVVVSTGSPKWGSYHLHGKNAEDVPNSSELWQLSTLVGTRYTGGIGTYRIDLSTYTPPFRILFRCTKPPTGIAASSPQFLSGIIEVQVSDNCLFDVNHVLISSGNFVSPIIETNYNTKINYFLTSTNTATINGAYSSLSTGTASYYVRSSSNSTGVFSSWEKLNNYEERNSTNTAFQYKAETDYPYITGVSLNMWTTGYWSTPEISLGGVTNWGSLVVNETTTGVADWTYKIQVSTYQGGSSSKVYEDVTPGATITASTGTYATLTAFNAFGASTETVRLNDLSFSWSRIPDGQATAFEYNGDIFFSVPYNDSLSNNRLMKYDTEINGWTIWDIALNAPVNDSDSIFFGSPTGGQIYQWPSGDNDAGSAINAYWKSKNFIGTDPYVEKQFDKLSLVLGSDYGSNLDVVYTIDTSTSNSYSVELTSTTADFVRNNRQLPIGDIGSFFNLQIGNNAANQPFSFYGARIIYKDDPWRVIP